MAKARDSAPESSSVGELEALVLEQLWIAGEMTTPQVYGAVGRPRGLAYTTILTVLQRLRRKGLVRREGEGKSHLYAPAVTRDGFSERRGRFLANAVVELNQAGVAALLAEAERLDPEFIAGLRMRLHEGDA
jgi:predicted transcriptional regulator